MAPGDMAFGGLHIQPHDYSAEIIQLGKRIDTENEERLRAQLEVWSRVENYGLQINEFGRQMNDHFERERAERAAKDKRDNRWKWIRPVVSSSVFATIAAALLTGAFQIWGAKIQTKQIDAAVPPPNAITMTQDQLTRAVNDAAMKAVKLRDEQVDTLTAKSTGPR